MTRTKKIKKFSLPIASLGLRYNWRIGLHRLILCMLILALMPLCPAPQPAHARGLIGKSSKVIPFIGVVVGWRHRNRVYRTSERFIQDRNQYYDGLLATAWQQLKQDKIKSVGRTRAAAYIKVHALIEQERAGQLAVAESRKHQARAQFHKRVEETVIYAAAGTRIAQEVIGSMLNGVDSMQQVLNRALSKFTSGGSDFLQDLQRIKQIASTLENVSSIVGGRVGATLGMVSGKIRFTIEQAELGVADIANLVQGDLQILHDELFILKEIGRKPTAGEVINQVKSNFLPEPSQEGSIPLDAIATILSELKAGDGSLKDEARRALNAGFAARCAEYSLSFGAQLESLKNSGQQELASEPATTSCKAVKLKKQGQETESEGIDELLEFEEGDEEEKEELPKVTASGTFSESMSAGSNTMGTTFQLTADFSAGTINGTLKGSRTSTPRGWMNCYNPADPSTELDRIDVNTTDSYEASFSGSIDKETGEFSITITPKGQTSATKVSLFTHEECLDKNSEKYPGEGGWNGKGTISGGVSKDGGIEFSTSWTYSWFYGEIQVTGQWSGNGIVEKP
jgi:hypothetical protein